MDAKLFVVALAALTLSSCATTPPISNLCTAGPIVLSPGATERLTRTEKEQIVVLNESGADICGWAMP